MRYFIGPYLSVFIAYATDPKTRYHSASGGVATALLRYFLEKKYVDAVVVPRSRFKQGFVYGVRTIVKDPSKLLEFSDSLYAPVYGLPRALTYALSKFKRIAVTALPCHAKAIRKISGSLGRSEDIFILGLYCLYTPSLWASKYALKYFGIHVEEVEFVKFRGYGWPGYTVIKTRKGSMRIPSSRFWGSGFGQYFHGPGCALCIDQTNVSSDISLSDPWTLPHECVKRLGGATLVVVRSRKGLEVIRDAARSGYISAVEIDPVYTIQYTTLLKLSKRVLGRNADTHVLPPSFTTIAHEVAYRLGHLLASREKLWPILKIYHSIASFAYRIASFLDYKLGTTWARVNRYIKLIQRMKLPKEGLFTELRSKQGC